MPPTLGQRLKHAREKRGLSLLDLAHTTRVPLARLQDLEDDKLNSFGGMAYAKSFLRSYAALLEVPADDVLNQMQPPPLGGIRDYRYLVETHGPWVTEKSERRHIANAHPTLAEGKSFLFAALVCLIFGLLVGGGVLANAYFTSKSAVSQPSPGNSGPAAVPSSAGLPEQLAGEQEFNLFGVSLTVSPEKPVLPPKAQAVKEPAKSAVVRPSKAEAVR